MALPPTPVKMFLLKKLIHSELSHFRFEGFLLLRPLGQAGRWTGRPWFTFSFPPGSPLPSLPVAHWVHFCSW